MLFKRTIVCFFLHQLDNNLINVQQNQSNNIKQDADIYKMNYKEFQCLIYDKIEELQSSIQSLLEVANRK